MTLLPAHTVTGHGPNVLLLHGTAPDLFDELTARLATDHRVTRVRRRGYPGSGLPIVHTLPPHADDAAALIREAGAPSIVVGWSIGGIIALDLALRHPDLVAGLVLIEPPWLAKRHATLRMVAGILGGKLRGALGNPGAGGLRFLTWALRHRDGTSGLAGLPAPYHAAIRAAGAAMLAELDGGTGEHLAGSIGPLRMPVVLLAGSESTPEFPAAAARLAATLQVEVTTVQGAAHLLQETHAEDVARAVRSMSTRRDAGVHPGQA